MPVPITYTFGNHMHWVDMQWLWGYHVLPGSIRDMIHFCRETGAKGNVNFDGVGYEKLAAEDPEALAELREAVAAGMIEPVGCSYGQPYGLFHGGESNVRQRVYGARAVRRLLGVWPKTFWEEEFDFFPQLPQMLKGCGFEYASLFFQWTWHTPEIPKEDVPVIWWEGQDGSRLLTATRNRLNLHQWPEDVQILMDELASGDVGMSNPLILQWLELMPSPDWMCRSEVLLPKTQELLGDPRFDITFATLGDYLRRMQADQELDADATPVREYTMDDVWHGMSLGKNGDRIIRKSIEAESVILLAEGLAATLGLFGRPYPQWDVYPTWELEEAWREALAAQHHDNHECEGLCGRVGYASFDKAITLATDVIALQTGSMSERIPGDPEREMALYNPLGWARGGHANCDPIPSGNTYGLVPAYGWRVVSSVSGDGVDRSATLDVQAADGTFQVNGLLQDGFPQVGCVRNGEQVALKFCNDDSGKDYWRFEYAEPGSEAAAMRAVASVEKSLPALDIDLRLQSDAQPDPGLAAGWKMPIRPTFEIAMVWADHPYGVSEVKRGSKGQRKYPTGDWMTSPQWFESVQGGFTALSFVDLVDYDGNGLLILHDGTQQYWLEDGGVVAQLGTLDPWDESLAIADFHAKFRLVPHGPIDHAQRWKLAQEFRNPLLSLPVGDQGNLPREFEWLECLSDNVAVTALFREQHTIDFESSYPYFVRVVELSGEGGRVILKSRATIAAAEKVNLLGDLESQIVTNGYELSFEMRPFEIATVKLDLVQGRKQTRDLDAHRNVWATVHRVDE